MASEFTERASALFVDGQLAPATGTRVLAIENPSYGQRFCEFHPATANDVDKVVIQTRKAFDDARWRGLPAAQRARIMQKIADLIEANLEELAQIEMLESGKLIGAARNAEVPFAAECFRYHSGWCTKIEGRTKPMTLVPPAEFHTYTLREPIGVAGLILPSNGPLVQASWKLSAALAAGCCAVLKPDEKTPLSTLRLAELCIEAGVPENVVNVVVGSGSDTGEALVRHPLISKISFTGSTRVGREIGRTALADFKKVTLELGGKSPVIVLADADLNEAIPGAAEAIFSNAGQVCVAGSRLYVEAPIYAEVIDGIVEYASSYRIGPADSGDTTMGPLISEAHLNHVLDSVQSGTNDGAKLATGGERIECQGGYYMSPAVFTDVEPGMELVREEIFGPVLVAASVANPERALHDANDSQYGLAASIWTSDLSRAHRMASMVRSGLVWVNSHGMPDVSVPFGGYRQSGWGRENGLEGLLAYTELKSVMCKL